MVSGSEDGKLFVWNTNTKSVMLQEDCFSLSKETINEKSGEGEEEEMGCAVVGCDVINDVVVVGCMEPMCAIKVYKIVQ